MGRSGSREQWEDLYRKMWRPAESSEVAGHQGLHVSVLQKRLWELNWSIRWVQVSVTFQKVNLQSPIIMNRLSGWICTDLQVELYAQLWALYFQEDAGPLEKVWKIALRTSSDSIIQPSREDWRNHSDLADQTENRSFQICKMQLHKGRINRSCLQWAEAVLIGLRCCKEDWDKITRKLYLRKITQQCYSLPEEAEDCSPLEAFKNGSTNIQQQWHRAKEKGWPAPLPCCKTRWFYISIMIRNAVFENGKWELRGLWNGLVKDRRANYKFLKCFKARKSERMAEWPGMPATKEEARRHKTLLGS